MEEARAHLEERVARDDLEEALEAFPTLVDQVIGETIGEDLARQRRDVDLRGSQDSEG